MNARRRHQAKRRNHPQPSKLLKPWLSRIAHPIADRVSQEEYRALDGPERQEYRDWLKSHGYVTRYLHKPVLAVHEERPISELRQRKYPGDGCDVWER
jgi:hypothetical protein